MRTPLLSRFLTIAFVLGLCLAAVLGRDLRLGKDLRGGVSLVYKVEIPEEEIDPQSVLDTTIEVLKARVNPQGIFDISIEGSGRDRIEVVMPLPGPETRALAAAWRTARATCPSARRSSRWCCATRSCGPTAASR